MSGKLFYTGKDSYLNKAQKPIIWNFIVALAFLFTGPAAFAGSTDGGTNCGSTTGTAVGQGSKAGCGSGTNNYINSTAVGFNAEAVIQNSTALGANSKANGIGSTALGYASTATGNGSLAINGTATGPNSTAINGKADSGMAIGGTVNGSMGGGVAVAGTVNNGGVAIMGTANNGGIAIGGSAGGTGQNNYDTAVGVNSVANSGSGLPGQISAAAFGSTASATGSGSTAMGTLSSASAENSSALGNGSKATANNATSLGAFSSAQGVGSTAAGAQSSAAGANSTAFGLSSVAGTTTNGSATAVGSNASATGSNALAVGSNTFASTNKGVALGSGASAANANSVALGADSLTSSSTSVTNMIVRGNNYGLAGASNVVGVVSVGNGTQTRQITNVAPGQITPTSTDAMNGSQGYALQQAINGITASGGTLPYVKFQSTLPDAQAFGSNTSAIGPSAYAGAEEALAVGAQAGAIGVRSSAFGTRAGAIGTDSVAVGSNAFTDVDNSVALGAGSVGVAAVGNTSMTIRGSAYALAGTAPAGSVSVGDVGAERQIKNLAAGSAPTDAANVSQVNAVRQAIENLSLNGGATPNPYVKFNSDEVDAQAVGNNSSAVGPAAQAIGDNSSAFGALAVAQAENSTAIGTRASAQHANSVAIGNDSTTQAPLTNPGMTIRGNAYTFAGSNPAGAFSVGAPGAERQIQNIAAGVRDTDAVNMAQYNALAGEVNNLSITGGGSGPITNVTNVYNSVVNKAPFFNANSTGEDSKATGAESVAVGGNAVATAANSVSIGSNSSTTGASAVALGYGATATGNNSVALGANTTASRSNEVNVGNRTVGGVSDAVYNDQAVNLSQARQMAGDTLSQANSYTDARSQQTLNMANSYTDAKIAGLKREMNAGDAMSMAAGSLVYGEKGYGVAAAVVNGQPALSWGKRWASKTEPGVYYSFKVAGARKTVGASIAMGW